VSLPQLRAIIVSPVKKSPGKEIYIRVTLSNILGIVVISILTYYECFLWIIIGSDRRPETKQGIEGKIVRFRSEGLWIGLGLGIIDRRSEPDRRSEAINFGAC